MVSETSPMTFLGIDPGQSGGIAWLSGNIATAVKMPATLHDISAQLSELSDGHCFCVMEKVGAMPKQGVASTFKFGKSAGWLEGCLAALWIPYELVPPGVWQRSLGCLSKGDKNVTKQKAQQLFPELKITHAKADALLLAEYARRVYKDRYGDN